MDGAGVAPIGLDMMSRLSITEANENASRQGNLDRLPDDKIENIVSTSGLGPGGYSRDGTHGKSRYQFDD